MPVDTSFYPTQQAQPFNPLVALGQVQGIVNARQQNQLMQTANQQEQLNLTQAQAQREAGQIITSHIGDDGSVDYQGALQDLKAAKNPFYNMVYSQMANALAPTTTRVQNADGSFSDVGSSMQDALLARNRLTPEQQQQADQVHSQIDGITAKVQSLLDLPDDQLTPKAVCSAVGDLCADGLITPKDGGAQLAGMPQSPDQIRGWLQGHYGNLAQHKQALNQVAPQTAPIQGLGQISQQELPPIGAQGTPPGQPNPPPGAAAGVEGAPVGPAANASPLAGKNVNPSVPVTQMADIANSQATGQKAYNDAQAKGQSAITLADNARLALQTLDSGVKTGKYTPAVTNLKAALISLGDEKNLPQFTNDVAGVQILGKELARVVGTQGLADSTDMARLQTQAQNADITKSAPAIRKILQYVQANAEGDKAIARTYANQANNNGVINGLKSTDLQKQIQTNYSPDVVRFKLMSPQEKQEFMRDTFKTRAQLDTFLQKYNSMKNLGLLDNVGQ